MRVDEVLTDERVRGLSPAARWAWVELRALAARGESGGVVLVPARRGGVRYVLHPQLRGEVSTVAGVSGPTKPHGRHVTALLSVGLLVPVADGSGAIALCDADRWHERESRMNADREAAKARRNRAASGGGESGERVQRRNGASVGRLDREVQHHPSDDDAVPNLGNGERTAKREPVRIRTAAHLQRPTGDDDIRPAVREAVTLARNVGTEDARQLLRDTLTDLGDLTMSETLHVATVLGEAGDGN